MSRVLVTGATGFIGQSLVGTFAAQGHSIRAAVRTPPRFSFPDGVETVEGIDLAQPIDWQPVLEGIDHVIHLAGIAHIGRGVAPERYDRVNRLATESLAKAAAAAGVRRFVLVSSVRAQTGPAADHVLTENDQPAPTDPYGRSKLAAEAAVRSAGVPFTILRPVVLYGPGAKGNVALLARIAASSLPLPLRSFTSRRSLLGIANFIAAASFVLSAPNAAGETYLVADPGPAPRLADIIATLRQAQGRRPGLLPLPPKCVEVPLRMIGRSDIWERFGGDLTVNVSKLLAAGWQPVHDTATGLAAMARSEAPQR